MKIRHKIRKSKKLLIIIISTIIILSAFASVGLLIATRKTDKVPIAQTVAVKQEQTAVNQGKTIHVASMGDMLAHDSIIANAKTDNGYDFAKFFKNIRPAYQNADVIFCNQEGLSSGEQYGISGYPSFNAPTKFSADLQSGAGCNLINLANNHMGDKGVDATNATIDNWTTLKPLGTSGANKTTDDQNKVSFSEFKGVKIGFVSFADFNNNIATPGYSINNYHDEALVRRLVTDARSNADIVIISMHWGVEDSAVVSVDQQNEANLLSSLGVDVIIGTGPHVLQKVDILDRQDGGKTIVMYSLGNMLSSQLNISELIGGVAQFDVTKTANDKTSVSNLTFIPTYMHYEWTAAESSNNDLMARKNAMIYLLSDASEPLSRSLFNTTVAAQKQYVIDTLGPEITVK